MNRRSFLKSSSEYFVVSCLFGLTFNACTRKMTPSAIDEIPVGFQLIFEKQQQAQKLKYTHNADSVDTQVFTAKKDNEMCQNCGYFTKLDTTKKYGQCALLNDSKWLVDSKGWCVNFQKKTS